MTRGRRFTRSITLTGAWGQEHTGTCSGPRTEGVAHPPVSRWGHPHGCQQTDKHNAKSEGESPHHLAIKQDTACSTPIGALLREQAWEQSTWNLQRKKGQALLLRRTGTAPDDVTVAQHSNHACTTQHIRVAPVGSALALCTLPPTAVLGAHTHTHTSNASLPLHKHGPPPAPRPPPSLRLPSRSSKACGLQLNDAPYVRTASSR